MVAPRAPRGLGTGLAAALDGSPPQPVTRRSVYWLAGDLEAALEYTVNSGGDSGGGSGSGRLAADDSIDFEAVAAAVAHHVQQLAGQDGGQQQVAEPAQEQQEQQPPSGGEAGDEMPGLEEASSSEDEDEESGSDASGRLGPAEVALVEARGACEIQGLCALSKTNFSTMRSNACVFKGRWQYEVQLGSAGILQLGWTTLKARFNSEEGVGDNSESYAYDGRRKMRWHVNNQPYGEQWATGDTIGCCLDLDAGTMRFYRNGKDLGEAFGNVRRGMPGTAYFAGVSLSFSERCEVNFGGRPFQHPVDGYQPLQLPPAGANGQLAVARYLAGCLTRLIDVSSSPAPPAAAAAAAEQAGESSDAGYEPDSGGESGGEEAAAAASATVASPPRRFPSLPGLLPDADMLASLAVASGEPGSSKGAALGLRHGSMLVAAAAPAAAAATGPAIRRDDRVLLGALLAQHLGPLCMDARLVETELLPLLDDAAGDLSSNAGRRNHGISGSGAGVGVEEGGGGAASEGQQLGRQRLQQLLELLSAVLEPEELSALVATSCSVLARRVRGSVWSLQEAPASPALAALRLWSAMLDCEYVRAAWLARPDWQEQLEALLAVRQPSEDDLTELMCNLKVTWADDGSGVVRGRRDEQNTFAGDLDRIAEGLEQIEACTADILLQVHLADSDGSGPSRLEQQQVAQQEQQPRGEELREQQPASEAQEEQPSQQPEGAAADAPLLQQEQEEQPGQQMEPQETGATPAEQQQPEQQPEQQHGQPEAAAVAAAMEQPEQQPSQQSPQQPQQQEAEPPGRFLRAFLAYLIAKNHGAMRHIPPPGLSDQTCLVSTAFALLRLMNDQVTAALPTVPTVHWDPLATFLKGGPLGSGDDPYYDAGRLGGTLSHLAREHPPTDKDRQALEGLPLEAVVTYDVPLRLAPRIQEGPSFSDIWLRDRLLMLCHLSVAPLMCGGLSHLAGMQAAMAGLRAMGSQEGEQGAGGQILAETMRQCQSEFVRSLRLHEWGQCWLLSPWRQQAAFVLAVSTAQLVEAVSAESQGGQLLRYVPELYCTVVLDMVHAVHRCEPQVLDHAAMLRLGLHHIVGFVMRHLDDERIVSPEIQTRLLQMVLDSIQELDLLRELGSNLESRRLMPALMRLFDRHLLWGPVSNVFALITEGCGFLHAPPMFPEEFQAPLGRLRELFKEACLSDAELCGRFMHSLFDHINRMLTELVASLEGMDTAWARTGSSPSSQLLRLLTSTADYAMVLLRTLELMTAEMPELFLDGGDMNITRVAEVVGFALPQLVSGRAHRALQRVAASRPMAARLRLREAHLLQPLAGTLLALCQAEQGQQAQQGGEEAQVQQQPRRHQSLVRALERQAALTDQVLEGLMDAELATVEPLTGEQAAATPEQAAEDAERRRRAGEQLSELRRVVAAVLEDRAAARGGAEGMCGGELESLGSADMAEVPDEFLDPILMTIMTDPIILPDSKVCLDRSTIERHLLSSATDPFSRAPLEKGQLVPNAELLQQIEAWLEGQRQGQRQGGE